MVMERRSLVFSTSKGGAEFWTLESAFQSSNDVLNCVVKTTGRSPRVPAFARFGWPDAILPRCSLPPSICSRGGGD